jgi:hypothetical protein
VGHQHFLSDLIVDPRHPRPLRVWRRQSRCDRPEQQVAADFIKRGIRVNAICSGTIESPSLGERVNEVSTKTGTPISEVAQCFTDRQLWAASGDPRKSQRWRSF